MKLFSRIVQLITVGIISVWVIPNLAELAVVWVMPRLIC